MRHGVAQQVVEAAGNAFEHAAVELNGAADDFQAHRFVQVFGGLTHGAVKPLGQAVELDHARAQQVALQLAGLARLAGHVVVDFAQQTAERALHQGDVVDRLGHHAGEFLRAGEAVEFERVEVAVFVARGLHLRAHLRLGLNFDFAHLLAQTVEVVAQIVHRSADGAELVFQPGARNGDFARLIDQTVEQSGAHAHSLCGDTRREGTVDRLGRSRRGSRSDGLRRQRLGRRSGVGLGAWGEHLGNGGRREVGQLAFAALCRAAQAVEAGVEMVETAQQLGQIGLADRRTGRQGVDVGFEAVRQVAELHGAGHARTAFERVQRPHGLRRGCGIQRMLFPLAQAGGQCGQQFVGLFLENREQVGIDGVDQLVGRRSRMGCAGLRLRRFGPGRLRGCGRKLRRGDLFGLVSWFCRAGQLGDRLGARLGILGQRSFLQGFEPGEQPGLHGLEEARGKLVQQLFDVVGRL